ncbi:MAG: riboflavin biosynthesis protein RibF [Ruminococcus sp.]|nr:riboflavin biosynthesis protein RibF [Ruminococcus sp.]
MQGFYELLPERSDTAVALGYFDGLHIGHRNVISLAANEKQNGLTPVCFTFIQSPKSVITGNRVGEIMSKKDKLRILSELGIEHTYQVDFRELMSLGARDFVLEILIGKLRAKKLFCGFNYRFGKNAGGDAEYLSTLCEENNVGLTVVPPERRDGEVVSSTLVRELISEGKIEKANELLCSLFGFTASVEHGKKLGRELGTPTINQPLDENLVVPRYGVYASVVTLESGEKYCGVTNIGIKPTVGGKLPLCETWLPEYHGKELYGQEADVRLLKFLRPEQKFESLVKLKETIIQNGREALDYYNSL